MHITTLIDTMSDQEIICDGCGFRLKQWEPEGEEEGDKMWIVPEAGGEKIYCENCFAKR
jgi:hypothetical protein